MTVSFGQMTLQEASDITEKNSPTVEEYDTVVVREKDDKKKEELTWEEEMAMYKKILSPAEIRKEFEDRFKEHDAITERLMEIYYNLIIQHYINTGYAEITILPPLRENSVIISPSSVK